eukprot:9477818-Pyramimonas_sp.AAC.1
MAAGTKASDGSLSVPSRTVFTCAYCTGIPALFRTASVGAACYESCRICVIRIGWADACRECPESISTCVNNHKLIDFLAMKFIPGRSLLPEDAHTGIVSEGHIFTEKTIPADPRVLMADFVAYILGRPKEAVPHD